MSASGALSERLRRECLEAAIQAPSIHNTQPWKFVAHLEGIEVLPDVRRRLEVVDPQGRALYISCGAAAENIRVFLAAHGWHSSVLFDRDPLTNDIGTTISTAGARQICRDDQHRCDAIWLRHTSRDPFENRAISAITTEMLVATAHKERATLRFLEADERDAFLSVVRTAELRQRRDPSYRAELGAWTEGHDGGRDDGVPASAFGAWSVMEAVPMRDFAIAHPVTRVARRFEFEPVIGLLSTDGDGKADWVRAGMALQRVWLNATVAGLALCPMTQPLELPDLRDLLGLSTPQVVPQVLFRIGHGAPGPPSPRRPVDEVLTVRAFP